MNVDMIIPVYRPDDTFCLLLQGLREQTFLIHRLILLNTEEALWAEASARLPVAEHLGKLPCEWTLRHVKKADFDHGGTRMLGAELSDADVIVFMTQDAVPADPYLIRRLVEPFEREGNTAVTKTGITVAGEEAEPGTEAGRAVLSGTEAGRAVQPGAKAGMMTEGQPQPDDASVCGATASDGGGVVAVTYARQLPNENCRIVEAYTRQFNYPDTGCRKSREDIPRLGIKTFFCSDVCAAYRRDLFFALGGFETPVIFNEDMFFAAKAVRAGYVVEYVAGARVVHSHNYTAAQQFHRNFDLAVSQADHPEIFAGIRSESEGIRLVKSTVGYLCRIGKPWLVAQLIWQCAGKYAGYFMGKRYRRLSRKRILKYTMSPDYWRKVWSTSKDG